MENDQGQIEYEVLEDFSSTIFGDMRKGRIVKASPKNAKRFVAKGLMKDPTEDEEEPKQNDAPGSDELANQVKELSETAEELAESIKESEGVLAGINSDIETAQGELEKIQTEKATVEVEILAAQSVPVVTPAGEKPAAKGSTKKTTAAAAKTGEAKD